MRDTLRAVADWLSRYAALVPPRDRVELVSPPIILARLARYAMKRDKGRIAVDDPHGRDPEWVGLMVDLLRVLARAFRLEIEGVERVPASGPALLVGNHNGALLPLDSFFTLLAIWEQHGAKRAVTMLAHDFLFEDDLFRRYAIRFGAVRAAHGGARNALRAGNLVLVYPGGDVETFRPFRERDRIDLAGRTGYVELALREGVPIVPVVSAGTHEQMVVLTRCDRFARAIRLHAWARAQAFPIMIAFPWGITSGFFPYLPLPAKTTIAFGDPIAWPHLSPRDAEDPAIVARCHAEVQARMQAMLDRLYQDRRTSASIDVATEIDAPAEKVWDVLTDLPRFAEWNPFIREASGSTAKGGAVRVHVEPSIGLPLTFEPTVLASEPGRELRWEGHFLAPWLARGEHTFSIEPLGPGRSRFTQHEEFGGLIPRLGARLLEREARRGFEDMNRALKARAEGA